MHLEIVIGGIGGQGALTAGQLLAVAGMKNGKWVTNTPVYSPEVRGGSSNALVVISDQPVGSMMVSRADAAIFLAHQSVGRLLPSLKPGARVVYNSTLVQADSRRLHDVEHVSLPCTDLATEVGGRCGPPTWWHLVHSRHWNRISRSIGFVEPCRRCSEQARRGLSTSIAGR